MKDQKKKKKKKTLIKGKGNEISKPYIYKKEIPPKLKYAFDSLMSFIQNNRILKWNSKGELLNRSTVMKGTDIMKLIFHSLTKMKKKPKGYKFFYNQLKKYKIPHYFKIKKNLSKYTETHDSDKWRPPGKLYKEKDFDIF